MIMMMLIIIITIAGNDSSIPAALPDGLHHDLPVGPELAGQELDHVAGLPDIISYIYIYIYIYRERERERD